MPYSQPFDARTTALARPSLTTGLEFLLTLLVVAFLAWMAAPLGVPGADLGLHERYGPQQQPASWLWFKALYLDHAWGRINPDLRAVALARAAGPALALVGGVGWLALQLARTGQPWARRAALLLWVAMGWMLRPFQWPGAVWAVAVMAALVLTTLAIAHALWVGRLRGEPVSPANVWVACVWPGWVLFTGIGCLLVLDFAARGPVVPGGMAMTPPKPGARYFGLHQVDGLWLASAVLVASVAWRGPLLRNWFAFCNLLAETWRRPRGPWMLAGSSLGLALASGWLGYFQAREFLHIPGLRGAGKPHISGEVLRLAACAALAWFAYRSGEWSGSWWRLGTGMARALSLLALCAAGFALSDDKGPLLVLALTLALLLGVPLVRAASRRANDLIVALLALSLVAVAVGFWRQAQVQWLSGFSTQLDCRIELQGNPFKACSPNRAQALWLMAATPASDLPRTARVAYCGAEAHAGRRACTLGSGAPLQLPSDLAYVLLYSTFGPWGAAALVALLLGWLSALPMGQLQGWRGSAHGTAGVAVHSRALLPVWLVAVPCVAAQAQVVVSVGATLGWSLLTGVTLPLLGYGSVALCAAGLWVGLAAHTRQA